MRESLMGLLLTGCLLVFMHTQLAAQDSSSLYDKLFLYPDKLSREIIDKTEVINDKVVTQTEKYLSKLAKQEKKLQYKLGRKDSLAAKRLFGDVQRQYAALQSRIRSSLGKGDNLQHTYLSHLDSLETALKFLHQKDGILQDASKMQARLSDALHNTSKLQDKFAQAEDVQRFIEQRKQLLQEQLGKYNMGKQLKRFGRQAYYYQAQVAEYRNALNDPSKIEEKVLGLVRETVAFKSFFAKHSELTSLFGVAGADKTSGDDLSRFGSLAGLQTRASVQEVLQQRLGKAGNTQQLVSERLQDAQQQLQERKKEVMEHLGKVGGSEVVIPDFKPNGQKTKGFLQRIELGGNVQTVKANRFFPSTTDMGISLGYKLNDRSVVGVGGSYKMGWGKDIRHVSISHQGVGARSFVDYKLNGSFWMSGGWEMNYRREFGSYEVLKNYSAWQKSALLGVSKKYQLSGELKGNMQVLYDFLWKQQTPRTQPVIFRIGYLVK